MVAVLAVGFVANLLIKPVSDRFHESAGHTDAFLEAHDAESGGQVVSGRSS